MASCIGRNPEREQKIKAAYVGREGEIPKIAKELGVSKYTVRETARFLGIYKRVQNGGRKVTDERKALISEVKEKYPTCLNTAEFAKGLGITKKQLRSIVKNQGLKRVKRSIYPNWNENPELREKIKEKYPTCLDREKLAAELGIKYDSLKTIASQLKVKALVKPRTVPVRVADISHDETIKEKWATLTITEIAAFIHKRRSFVFDRAKALQLGTKPRIEKVKKEKVVPTFRTPEERQALRDKQKKERQAEKALKVQIKQAAATKQATKKKQAPAPFKIKTVDPSQTKSVRVDKKTVIQIPINADPVAAIKAYQDRRKTA